MAKSRIARDTVYVVYGRDLAALAALKRVLHAMNVDVLSWEQAIAVTGNASAHATEVVRTAMTRVRAVIVLITGDTEGRLLPHFCRNDDEVRTEGILRPQARQNVIFEAGFAFGLFPARTIIVKIGRSVLPSDLEGLQYVALDNSRESLGSLSNRLRIAGCNVPPDFQSDPEIIGGLQLGSLPALRTTGASRSYRLALFRRLRTLLPLPGLGGDIEVASSATIGEKLMLSVRTDLPVSVKSVEHWAPGAASPEVLDLAEAVQRHGALELPIVMTRPAGIHYFDLMSKQAESGPSEVVARTNCAVSEA